MPRYDKHTETEVQDVFYRDFDASFRLNPVTGNLAVVQNAEDVKKMLRNLVLTARGERFYQPTLGTKVGNLLFENADEITIDLVRTTIDQSVRTHMPMVEIIDVKVEDAGVKTGLNARGHNAQPNTIRITIVFTLINLGITDSVTVPFRRVR